jgi:nickel/cobalt transporter (NicO) family protein
VAITLGKQNRDSIQQRLTMDYVIGSAALATSVPATVVPAATIASNTSVATTQPASVATPIELPAGAPEQARQLLGYLYAPTRSPWVLLLALGLAGVLGGLHALTPGHGKTLVAAYLVGSRGTVRNAVTLGAIVTFTHTASVIAIGLLALFASQFVVPNVLVPILEVLSGLLVVFLGVRLVWQRWIAFHNSRHSDHEVGAKHHHDHAHDHSHPHDHGDGHSHTHLPPAEGIKLSNLVAMGVSGGLVPCPEALGIMVIAIGLNRILLGLAAVLIILGILLVRSRALVERVGGIGSRWSSALPLASAVLVTILDVGMTLSGLATYLGSWRWLWTLSGTGVTTCRERGLAASTMVPSAATASDLYSISCTCPRLLITMTSV